ncbi:MAG: ketoacyl-ACP synthase III [Desulfovibrio sp.]|jgi:3-oxoacyl-[acyl-carrier-protein] synthase-3|nr:ketoacyl-ACP synthase III [Desulfovibrio sp.]
MNTSCIIRGLGHCVPDSVLTNADFERMVDTNDEWIVTRTGIRERHVALKGETCVDLCHGASVQALKQAGMEASDITHVVLATFSPDAFIPSAACMLSHRLGISGRMAMDVSAACSGFLYALETARALIALHPQAKVLLAACDIVSSRVDYTDRGTCVLFGDGAGAAVITADGPGLTGGRVLDVLVSSDGAVGDLLTIKGGGSGTPYKLGDAIRRDFFVEMNGREVYKHAVRAMSSICEEMLTRHGLTTSDVDVFIPHQANLRIVEAVGKRLDMPEAKVFTNLQKYGNTSAASVPLALSEAVAEGFVKPGSLVLLGTFGGGFTWGSGLLKF